MQSAPRPRLALARASAYWLVFLGSWGAACRASPGEPPQEEAPTPDDPIEASEGGARSPDAGGTRATSPELQGRLDDAGSSAASAGARAAAPCTGQLVTLAEIHAGRVRGNVTVALEDVVAGSQKFLVSEAKSGSCLWGAMVAHPTHVGRGSGLFVVSFGEPHADGERCRPGADGLPDDLEPGDRLAIVGQVDAYVPPECHGIAAAPQLRVEASCGVRRVARGEPPQPAALDLATADAIAAGTDAALLREWSGALVRLEHVSAREDPGDGDGVFPFGLMRVEETALEVHSRLYYFDLTEGGPRSPGKAPQFGYPLELVRVTGHIFLDYCSWVLAPRSRCLDMTPASRGCRQ
jgi:hypothetical protein